MVSHADADTLQINVAGMEWINSYGMLQNLAYAARVKDMAFFNAIFPAFFEQLDEEKQKRLRRAFLNKTIQIAPGPNEGDAILTVQACNKETK